ncbi:Eco57I restriction-modification methylase domain-containing protein [Streptococcus sp. HF-1907]|uniref:Eco57I restriction-modification methylase domain-containing protein n=1 Tax=Streptococcus sp. HF-1907 TaxID=2785793 RepID=UPI00189D0A07|nr:Eco57I restriction-modification methylase domain-containing protein [Streptococcus sp. HF-1907]MBF7093885.1 Eco57I restriction-modification methylase domain-containing protein [Streptococcus sp. HF-1907]
MDILSQAVDLDERRLYQQSPDILKILLKDRTTKRNIVWGTSSYDYLGKGFESYSPITVKQLATYDQLIQPRSEKTRSEQKARTKVNAEVFTPTWLVKKQTDFAEEDLNSLPFEDYVTSSWLEITCGEAPYIVTRYDAVSGDLIPLSERVGFLDRKLARISKEVSDEEQWLALVRKAYQASYGYEWQGDSLLLARENLLLTFEDYYQAKFDKTASQAQLKEIATIISYNLFQMDGLNYISPAKESQVESQQLSLFDDVAVVEKTDIKTQLKNWKTKKMLGFERLANGENEMKFDVVIGNPPYQKEGEARDEPIYHNFMSSNYDIADKVCLITPARFLFDAGQTPKPWNKQMLNDEHLKVSFYEQKSSNVFPNTDIKAGVAITYRDSSKLLGPIKTFTVFSELTSIVRKVERREDFLPFSDIVQPQGIYRFSDLFFEEFPEALELQGKGTKSKIVSKSLVSLEFAFPNEVEDEDDYIRLLGRIGTARVYRYIKKEYINSPETLFLYKVFVPEANGSGAIGEVLSTPLIGEPLIGHTDTFLTVGGYDNIVEAENLLKYIKTKFARTLLGVLKATQHNSRATWAKVPLQDFTVKSDIDWSQSVADIDHQLYKKYNLSQEEIDFIEEKVKEME